MTSALFISDLHLNDQRRMISELFLAFLRDSAALSERLYILGDLFEYWVGDDQLDHDRLARAVADALASLGQKGCAVFFMHGNRDFLVGERFAAETRATLLADPSVIDLFGEPCLLTHGDLLCTEDHGYQLFRQESRSYQWKSRFLARPYVERLQIAHGLRAQSETAKGEKAEDIMDVTQTAVEQMMENLGCATMIHGHTHRPAVHNLMVNHKPARRWVLADWYASGEYLKATSGQIERISLAAQA